MQTDNFCKASIFVFSVSRLKYDIYPSFMVGFWFDTWHLIQPDRFRTVSNFQTWILEITSFPLRQIDGRIGFQAVFVRTHVYFYCSFHKEKNRGFLVDRRLTGWRSGTFFSCEEYMIGDGDQYLSSCWGSSFGWRSRKSLQLSAPWMSFTLW